MVPSVRTDGLYEDNLAVYGDMLIVDGKLVCARRSRVFRVQGDGEVFAYGSLNSYAEGICP